MYLKIFLTTNRIIHDLVLPHKKFIKVVSLTFVVVGMFHVYLIALYLLSSVLYGSVLFSTPVQRTGLSVTTGTEPNIEITS